MLDYLNHARPGTSIAIFGLTTQLVMLQGFTSDSELLKTVVTRQRGHGSPYLNAGDSLRPSATITDQLDDMGSPLPAQVVSRIQTFEDMQTSKISQSRAKLTLDALSALARYLANLPGRKNLIWFSGSFPIDLGPDFTNGADDPFAQMANAEQEYHDTVNALARSQVAVYPIDARGLLSSPTMSAAVSAGRFASDPAALGRDEQNFRQDDTAEHSTMERMATDTGGRAFINTNGFADAVNQAVDAGSSYYTLTYTPQKGDLHGEFRRVQVKLAGSGYQLAYRRGYYAADPAAPVRVSSPIAKSAEASAPAAMNPLRKAMLPGLPEATQILFKVSILPVSSATEPTAAADNLVNAPGFAPAKGPYRRYRVYFAVDPRPVLFVASPDGFYEGDLDFATVLYQPDGRMVNVESNSIHLKLTPEQQASC